MTPADPATIPLVRRHVDPARASLALVLLLLVVGTALPRLVRADDEEWKARLEGEATRIETGVAALDALKASTGTLVERVKSLQDRLVAVEKANGLVPGTVAAKDDLTSLTKDVTTLSTRLKAVLTKRNPPKERPPDDPVAKPKPPPAPKQPRVIEWPSQIAFSVTAKVDYAETGTWFKSPFDSTGLGPDYFRLDGYVGSFSWSLRAKGLPRDVKAVRVRLAIKLKAPLVDAAGPYHVFDVGWTANAVLNNDALRSWRKAEDISVHLDSPKWIGLTKNVSANLDAEAYLISATLPDGTEKQFEVPDFNKK